MSFFNEGFFVFQRFTYKVVITFHIFKLKRNFLHKGRKYAYLNRNWSNTIKLPIIAFVENPFNTNRVVKYKRDTII